MWRFLPGLGLICAVIFVNAGTAEDKVHKLENGSYVLTISANNKKDSKQVEVAVAKDEVTLKSDVPPSLKGKLDGKNLKLEASQKGMKIELTGTLKADNSAAGKFTLSDGKRTLEGEFTLTKMDATDAARAKSRNNLQKLAVAMHNYHNDHKRLPLAYELDKNKKPTLSWRVTLLPYLEQKELYKKFKLDEPWDSDHNKKLLDQMPSCFAPVLGGGKDKTGTHYQVFQTSKGSKAHSLFNEQTPMTLAAVTSADGASNTILIVEAPNPVPWTKPEDLPFDSEKPLPKLGGTFKEGFFAALGDGSVRFIKNDADEKKLRALVGYNDGVVVRVDDVVVTKDLKKQK